MLLRPRTNLVRLTGQWERFMLIDRRTVFAGMVAAGAMAHEASAQTPPPLAARAQPPGLPQPSETIDLWPKGAPGAPATPLIETVNERSTDTLVTDRAVFGITRPRMAVFRPDRPLSLIHI